MMVPLKNQHNVRVMGEEYHMKDRTVSLQAARGIVLVFGPSLACTILLVLCGTVFAQSSGSTKDPAGAASIQATHILGFARVANNSSGKLSIEGKTLQFQKEGGAPAQVDIDSIQDVLLGVEDKQVGGTPLALGRAATPFGGGRVIGLFSHKKYDTLTLEYVDATGGFHGAIFQLQKGQGQVLKTELLSSGAHVAQSAQGTAEAQK
jgi:hypothetical protein